MFSPLDGRTVHLYRSSLWGDRCIQCRPKSVDLSNIDHAVASHAQMLPNSENRRNTKTVFTATKLLGVENCDLQFTVNINVEQTIYVGSNIRLAKDPLYPNLHLRPQTDDLHVPHVGRMPGFEDPTSTPTYAQIIHTQHIVQS